MSFLSGFLNSIILLGSLQGFIIGVILYLSSKERPSNKFFGWLLFIMAVACLKIYLNNIGFTSTPIGSLIDAFFPFMLIMAVGPLIYFYCRSELIPEFQFQQQDRKHFYPVIIDVFHHLSAIAFLIVIMLGWVNPRQNDFGYWFDTYNVYSDIPRWISLTTYLIISYQLLTRVTKELKSNNQVIPRSFLWVREFLIVFMVFDFIWLLFTVPYVIPAFTDTLLSWVDWYPVYIPIVAIIYWLGIRAFLIDKKERTSTKSIINKLSLSPATVGEIVKTLQNSMEIERLYRDSELNLSKLAKQVGVSSKTISIVLNQHLNKSFNEYVNHYRIDEVKERLLKGEARKLTITALAYECGFNSQPTFQRAFKSMVGRTPREFLQVGIDSPVEDSTK